MADLEMTRRLVATVPCRLNSSRLFAKPLQQIIPGISIAEYLVRSLQSFACVADVRLAIAEGVGECAFVELARRIGCAYTLGSEADVLGRVIECARNAGATDVLRKTSEDPFFDYSALEPAWARHLEAGNDVTALDDVPEGTAFEIFTLETLERSHARSSDSDREHIANYARYHQDEFTVEVLEPVNPACRRLDLRLTVDNPEDLILCREVVRGLESLGPLIPLREIVWFLDRMPRLTELVAPFVHAEPTWRGARERSDV
jgi:spore coat polysaccharide biosynthesis protein SpsF